VRRSTGNALWAALDAHDLTSLSVLRPNAMHPCVCLSRVRERAANNAVPGYRGGIIEDRKQRGVLVQFKTPTILILIEDTGTPIHSHRSEHRVGPRYSRISPG
jgi:hypothetical protein